MLWKKIFKKLTDLGYDVYPPGVKNEECKDIYVVVKNDGGSRLGDFSSQQILYDFLIYTPRNRYDEIEDFIQKIKKDINVSVPELFDTGQQTPPFYDEEIAAYMVSFLYRCSAKNNKLGGI